MNIKKFSFAFLSVLILALVSCMNMNSSNGKEGTIRIQFRERSAGITLLTRATPVLTK